MRRKEPGRGDTPLRRSTRLQQEKTGEQLQVSKEPQRSKERSTADILQPRESIRAHRQVIPTKEPTPPPPSSAPVSVPGPETPKDSKQAMSEKDNVLPPFVRLKRLDIPQEEESSPHQNRPKELQDPDVEWEVVKDQRARLRVLETRPRTTEARATVEQDAPSRQGMVANRTLRQQARVGLTPQWWSPASQVQARKEADPQKLPRTALPPKATNKKWTKQFLSLPSLCFLLFLLILGFACWFVWKYGIPVSFLGLAAYGQWGLSGIQSVLWSRTEECSTQCSLVLVESIPDTLSYQPEDPRHLSIYQAWMGLLAGANSSVDIAAFYFTLRDSDIKVEDPSSQQGRDVFDSLLGLPSRGVKLNIAVNSPQMSENDTEELARQGADIEYVNMKNLTGGIVHTKFWVVDQQHVYVGSANMDWRSLTQVKELGAVLYNCSCLAQDLGRIFAMYRMLGGEEASIPTTWPASVAAKSSLDRPLKLQLNGSSADLYISSSPPALCSAGRTSDLMAIVHTIEDAQAFVYIAVMDYEPQCSFCRPRRFWPVIDDALRAAACDRRVNVRLLISCWPHSHPAMFVFLESLSILSQKPLSCPIEVNLFVVPGGGERPPIPYSHVNHNKYMVTDRVAYIGTSNWSEDYFTRTTGVGLIINQSDHDSITAGQEFTLRHQLEQVFLRDWNSPNVLPLSSHRSCSRRN